jgi:hypothetical protein
MKTTTHRKILALVLICTMILTLMPALPVAAEEIIGVPTEPTLDVEIAYHYIDDLYNIE